MFELFTASCNTALGMWTAVSVNALGFQTTSAGSAWPDSETCWRSPFQNDWDSGIPGIYTQTRRLWNYPRGGMFSYMILIYVG